MHRILELDQFGTNVKWRFQSKDTFKSYFGAVTFIIMFLIFLTKVVFFAIKIREYGFARNQISEAFIEDYQLTNLTDLKFIIVTDLSEKLSNQKNLSNYFKNKNLSSSKFNLTDFLDIQPINLNPQLQLKEYDCRNTKKFKNYEKDFNVGQHKQNDNNSNPNNNNTNTTNNNNNTHNVTQLVLDFDLLSAKCLAFDESKNFINITKNETLLKGTNALLDLQLDIFSQFGIYFKMDDELVKFLNQTKQNFSVYLFYSNFKLNPDDYQFHQYYSAVSFTVDVHLQTKAEITFRKISVSQIIEVDIFDAEFLNESKYNINRDSFETFKISRENGVRNLNNGEIFYADFFTFNFNIWEEKNSVTILSTDDVLAVLGGFIEITFSIGEFFITMHNENLVRKIFNHFFFINLETYEENMTNLKNNVEFQKIYFCPFDKDNQKNKFKEKENKVRHFFNKKNHAKESKAESNKEKDLFKIDSLKDDKNLHKFKRGIEKSKSNAEENCFGGNKHDFKINNGYFVNYDSNRKKCLFRQGSKDIELNNLGRNNSNLDYCKKLTHNSSILNANKINEDDRYSIRDEKLEIPFGSNTRKTKDSLENEIEKKLTNNIDDSSLEQNFNLEEFSNQDLEKKITKEFERQKLRNSPSKSSSEKENKGKSIDPTKTRKSRLLSTKCDYSQIICIEKFLDLISTVETLKSFLFDKLNKHNFEDLAKLHIYSDNFEYFKLNDELFQFRLEKLSNEFHQEEVFKRIYTLLDNY